MHDAVPKTADELLILSDGKLRREVSQDIGSIGCITLFILNISVVQVLEYMRMKCFVAREEVAVVLEDVALEINFSFFCLAAALSTDILREKIGTLTLRH